MRTWIGRFSILIANFFLRQYYLQWNNFSILTDKESVIISAVIPVHNAEK